MLSIVFDTKVFSSHSVRTHSYCSTFMIFLTVVYCSMVPLGVIALGTESIENSKISAVTVFDSQNVRQDMSLMYDLSLNFRRSRRLCPRHGW